MQMPIVAPLFIEDGNFTSTLVLVNGSQVATYADVFLRSLDGKTVAKPRIHFPPYSQRQVAIRDLRDSGIASGITSGSVTVLESPSLSGMVITAALSITQFSSPNPHYIDRELAMPSTSGSNMLTGVVDSSDGSPTVAITSLSDMPEHVTVTCLQGTNKLAAKTVTLSPDETLLTMACTPGGAARGGLRHLY
jgi:hypothetical protein